ncbi:hypothetical protein FQZ97_980520 [compost metagenome]
MAEAGHRAVDQARIDRAQALIVQAIALEAAGLEILDHDVAVAGQLADQCLPFGLRHVHGDRALVAVGRGEIARLPRRHAILARQERRAPVAGIVAFAGLFDLDDVGAHVRQVLGGPRPGQYARQVEHAQVAQRAGARRRGRQVGKGVGGGVSHGNRGGCVVAARRATGGVGACRRLGPQAPRASRIMLRAMMTCWICVVPSYRRNRRTSR